jgi:UDP-N-acetylmuramoyl-tripeptide--D-alanyl-D-alanine ligase
MKLPLSRITELVGASGDFDPHAVAGGYSIDSRTIRSGELFFAVKGEKMDGHDFVAQARESGAVAAVVSRERFTSLASANPNDAIGGAGTPTAPRSSLIVVEDTLEALQLLARGVRRLWARPLIAVTGSAGKTTTKEAIAQVLSTRFRVQRSEGNFNNHFGLPLMLLKLEPEHDMAVVELGMSHLGEITALAQIAQPNIGVVTNVAPVHLEFFSSISEIARAKYELIESLPVNGTAVLNGDDEYVSQFGREFKGKVISYGFGPASTVRAEKWESRGEAGSAFDVVIGSQRERVSLPLVGRHNVHNALAAIAVSREHGLTLAESVAAIAKLSPADKRGQVVRIGNITLINDCYNSNPKALAAMVDALAEMPAKRRIVVAGEMLELGPEGEEMHREAGRHIAAKSIDVLIGVRGLAQAMVDSAKKAGVAAEFVATPEEAGERLAQEGRDGDAVLLKASRGVKLEKALEKLSAISQSSGKA